MWQVKSMAVPDRASGGLVGAARAGDITAFEILIGPLVGPAYRLAAVMLQSSRADAEDAIQEATLRAWRSLRSFRGDEVAFKAWFMTIVANQCRQVRRSRWWSVVRMPATTLVPGIPTDEIITREYLVQGLNRLSTSDRAALHLYFSLDLHITDVAKVLGVTVDAAKSRIHRALQRLKVQLDEEDVNAR
jgi:RNA polymerase sigma factor (sigma-70 family)